MKIRKSYKSVLCFFTAAFLFITSGCEFFYNLMQKDTEVTLSFALDDPLLVSRTTGTALQNPRTATAEADITQNYWIKLYATKGEEASPSVTRNVDEIKLEGAEYKLNLSNGTWKIKAEVYTDSEHQKLALAGESDSFTISKDFEQSGENNKVTIPLKASKNSGKKGKISLKLYTPYYTDTPLINRVDVFDDGEIDLQLTTADAGGVYTAPSADPQTDPYFTVNIDPYNSGATNFYFYFYKDNVLVYRCTEAVNVFDNMTTNVWTKSSASGSDTTPWLYKNDDGEVIFRITEQMIRDFGETSLYVAGEKIGDEDPALVYTASKADGSIRNPYNSIQDALKRIQVMYAADIKNGLASSRFYTIYIDGKITYTKSEDSLLINGTGNILLNLKLCAYRPLYGAEIDGNQKGCILFVGANSSVTLENITITNGKYSYDAGGVQVNQKGYLNLGGKVVIDGNSAEDAANGNGNLYLLSSGISYQPTVNIVSPLSAGSKIGITIDSVREPTAGGIAGSVKFTQCYGNFHNADEQYFYSDKGLGVAMVNGEMAFVKSGGVLNVRKDQDIKLYVKNTEIYSDEYEWNEILDSDGCSTHLLNTVTLEGKVNENKLYGFPVSEINYDGTAVFKDKPSFTLVKDWDYFGRSFKVFARTPDPADPSKQLPVSLKNWSAELLNTSTRTKLTSSAGSIKIVEVKERDDSGTDYTSAVFVKMPFDLEEGNYQLFVTGTHEDTFGDVQYNMTSAVTVKKWNRFYVVNKTVYNDDKINVLLRRQDSLTGSDDYWWNIQYYLFNNNKTTEIKGNYKNKEADKKTNIDLIKIESDFILFALEPPNKTGTYTLELFSSNQGYWDYSVIAESFTISVKTASFKVEKNDNYINDYDSVIEIAASENLKFETSEGIFKKAVPLVLHAVTEETELFIPPENITAGLDKMKILTIPSQWPKNTEITINAAADFDGKIITKEFKIKITS